MRVSVIRVIATRPMLASIRQALGTRLVVAGLRTRLALTSSFNLGDLQLVGRLLPHFDDDELPDHLWLVPKKRTTRSRKRMKTWMLGPKPLLNIYTCPDCGNPKLHHKLSKCCVDVAIRKSSEYKEKLHTAVSDGSSPPKLDQPHRS